jgi:hypothetical protein
VDDDIRHFTRFDAYKPDVHVFFVLKAERRTPWLSVLHVFLFLTPLGPIACGEVWGSLVDWAKELTRIATHDRVENLRLSAHTQNTSKNLLLG